MGVDIVTISSLFSAVAIASYGLFKAVMALITFIWVRKEAP